MGVGNLTRRERAEIIVHALVLVLVLDDLKQRVRVPVRVGVRVRVGVGYLPLPRKTQNRLGKLVRQRRADLIENVEVDAGYAIPQ